MTQENTKCRCRENPIPAILGNAIRMFDNQHPLKEGYPEYEWKSGGTGEADTDNDKVREIDCSHLPWEAIKAVFANDECQVQIPFMTTHYFRELPIPWYAAAFPLNYADKWVRHMYQEMIRDRWYCRVDPDQAGVGDIIVWQMGDRDYGHMGIVRTNYPDFVEGRRGTAYNSTSRRDRRPNYRLDPTFTPEHPKDAVGWTGPAFSPWNLTEGVTFWRPKVCECPGGLPEWPERPPSRRVTDPLTLDLDGNGIRTISIDDGVFIDHDANGFHEHTGWVAHGDGMLMLDWNNNGRLDSGMELFGEYTLLSTGIPVGGDGFQVLSLYDANHDGKIDAEDPNLVSVESVAIRRRRRRKLRSRRIRYYFDRRGIGYNRNIFGLRSLQRNRQ